MQQPLQQPLQQPHAAVAQAAADDDGEYISEAAWQLSFQLVADPQFFGTLPVQAQQVLLPYADLLLSLRADLRKHMGWSPHREAAE